MPKNVRYAVGRYSLLDDTGCTLEIFDTFAAAESFAELNQQTLNKD